MSERETIAGQRRRAVARSHEPRRVAFDDLRVLLPDWELHLRAANKAPLTIDSYLAAGKGLLESSR